MKTLILAALSVALLACESVPPVKPAPTPPPVTLGPEGSETISFTKVITRMPTGTLVGAVYTSSSEKDSRPLYWKSNLSFSEEDFRLAAIDELQRYGFAVLGADQMLFDQAVKYKPRYLLGGVLTDLAYSKYTEKAGNSSKSSLLIDWQLYDTQLERSVFRKSVRGDARLDGDQSLGTIFVAFNKALEELLMDKQFVNLVSKKPSSAVPEEGVVKADAFIALGACPSRTLSLPDDIAIIQQSVVEVRGQDNIGSGVLVSRDGFVLTAARWVRDAKTISVLLKSGLILDAEVVRVAGAADVALLKISGNGHPCLPFLFELGASVGKEVYAVGSASVTKAVLSGAGGQGHEQELQVDGDLGIGNVGGPVLDKNGSVLGIVTLKGTVKGIEGVPITISVGAVQEALRLSAK